MRSTIVNFFLLLTLLPHQIIANPRDECRNRKFDKYLVSIQTDLKHRCTGVILNSNTILTTALCLTDHIYRTSAPGTCDCAKNVSVIYSVGSGNMEGLICAKDIKVLKTVMHPAYNRSAKEVEYDVAILKTKGYMDLGKAWKEPPLSSDTWKVMENCDAEAVLTGFWMDKYQKEPNVQAPCIDVQVANKKLCMTAEGEFKPVARNKMEPRVMCVFDSNLKSPSICRGYFGSPIFCREKKTGISILYGFLSHRKGFSERCEPDETLVYARLQTYNDFLQRERV
ncbi:granzyme M-like [Harmonia axyridis]|uniref:granzyme M-like n=1 Tax=Harmonia axyridis TaxID=115357 RepID=UPI001E279B7A|nr:granzyme M-like [Harmonia axyridis]